MTDGRSSAAPRKRRVIFIAQQKWAIGYVHDCVAARLRPLGYEFGSYNPLHFDLGDFLTDVARSDVVITTANLNRDIQTILTSDAQKRKILVLGHGSSEFSGVESEYSEHITYAVTSDVAAPFCKRPVLLMPNGVELEHFERRVRDGHVRTLGWCGSRYGPKRMGWSHDIAHATQLPVTIAMSLPRDELKKWYHGVDVLLINSGAESHIETGPLPAFEAIASGCVVVGTSVGNFRLVPGPKYATVAEAATIINELKQNPDAVRRLADEQYACVRAHWCYEVLVDRWREAIDRVAERGATVPETKKADEPVATATGDAPSSGE